MRETFHAADQANQVLHLVGDGVKALGLLDGRFGAAGGGGEVGKAISAGGALDLVQRPAKAAPAPPKQPDPEPESDEDEDDDDDDDDSPNLDASFVSESSQSSNKSVRFSHADVESLRRITTKMKSTPKKPSSLAPPPQKGVLKPPKLPIAVRPERQPPKRAAGKAAAPGSAPTSAKKLRRPGGQA